MQKDKIKSIPIINPSMVSMNEPNNKLLVYKGEFIFFNEDIDLIITGEIYYTWFPRKSVKYEGQCKQLETVFDIDLIFNGRIKINEEIIGNVFTTHSSNLGDIGGEFENEIKIGDISIPSEKIYFNIPNLVRIIGETTKDISKEGKVSFHSSRICLDNGRTKFIIDTVQNKSDIEDKLRNKGGYLITHTGVITNSKSSIVLKEIKEDIECFNIFISFLNGRRTAAFFFKGVYENEIKWEVYHNSKLDIYKYVHHWLPKKWENNYNSIWQKFNTYWDSKNDRDFLNSLIHWYVEANGHSGYTEGSIIMAQTAVELIFNWWLVKQKRIILGKDAVNLSASNKLRMVISEFVSDYTIPDNFKELRSVASKLQINDAPEIITLIRNIIVHSNNEKGVSLEKINSKARFQALQMYLWYIELSLLKILGYKGKYHNRVSSNSYIDEIVPWRF